MKEMRVHVPQTRAICFTEKIMKDVVWEIEKYTFVDINFQKKILAVLNRPYWIVRQYVPFLTVDKLNGKNSKEYWSF